MSDMSDTSDKESLAEKDDEFNVKDDEHEIESDESYNDLINDNMTKNNDEENNSTKELQGNDEYVGPILPGGHRFDKKLVCIKYPGNVVNPEKAIETLGGVADISTTVDTRNRRIELRFRPDDGYCKPACGDRHQTTGFLLRVRIKKSRIKKMEEAEKLNNNVQMDSSNDECENTSSHTNKDKNSTKNFKDSNNVFTNTETDKNCSANSETPVTENNENKDSNKNKPPTFNRNKYENLSEDHEYELPKLKVLGRVDTEFRFTNLCDFQYLPITKNKDDPLKDECIYESIYPVGLPPFSWMKNEVPYFLPPAAFSRMDSVQQYVPKTEVSNSDAHYVIGKTRKRRSGFSNFISFNTPYVPTTPPKGIETAMRVKFLQMSHVETMRKAFEDRPIWSKTALMYVTKFSNEQLKILLPSVAYYFMTGPWRITWVKLGYDPRKDPEARKYQTLDYRLKAMHGLHSNITCKRNYSEYTLPYRNTSNSKAKAIVLMSNTDKLQSQKKQKMIHENVYIYRPGIIPPSRQMFYQYCDVHVKEIQDMLDKYVGPPPGTPCHEKLGWLPVGFDDLCREIINKQVRVELRKLMNIPENHPTTLPRKRKLKPCSKSRKRYNKKPKGKRDKSVAESSETTINKDTSNCSNEEDWEDISEDSELIDNKNEHENKNENKNQNIKRINKSRKMNNNQNKNKDDDRMDVCENNYIKNGSEMESKKNEENEKGNVNGNEKSV